MKSWAQFPTLHDTNMAAYTVIPAFRRWRQESHPDYIGSSKPTGAPCFKRKTRNRNV